MLAPSGTISSFPGTVLPGFSPTSMASYQLLGHHGCFLFLSLPLLGPWTFCLCSLPCDLFHFLAGKTFPLLHRQILSPTLPRMPGSHSQLTGQHLHMKHYKGELHTRHIHNALLSAPPPALPTAFPTTLHLTATPTIQVLRPKPVSLLRLPKRGKMHRTHP